MAENQVSSDNNQSNGSKPSKLKRAWIITLVLIVIVQVLDFCNSGTGILTALRCLSQILIVILIVVTVVQWIRGRGEERVSEPIIRELPDPQAAFREGQLLMAQGKRDQAVKVFLKIVREGPDELRQQAIDELDLLDEMETF